MAMDSVENPRRQLRHQSLSARKVEHSGTSLWAVRSLWIIAIIGGLANRDLVQWWVNKTWDVLYSSPLFNSVYFETWWTASIYTLILAFARVYGEISYFDRYKLNPAAKCMNMECWKVLAEGIEYCAPLMLLDTFMVKKYKGLGIDSKLWVEKRKHWIQETRVLPRDPPQIEAIVCHLVLSVFIYDAVFFAIHFAVHKNLWLYKHVHATHHTHGVLNARITNLLSVPERIILVLSANEALKVLGAHPMTRLFFVPVFTGMLAENHCGYDFPWSYDKLLPPGMAGGAYVHYQHHMVGDRHYQPFLTYLDKLFVRGKAKPTKLS